MRHVLPAMLVVVGLIHLLPLSGLLSNERLAALYGITVTDPNLSILMRHRAVLFGILGVFMLVSAFRPALQIAALVMGFVSVISFIWLAWSIGNYNAPVARVVSADIVALCCLLVGAIAFVYARSRG